MAQPSITVEQFFKEHCGALQMRLLSAETNLKRIIREPTVNRPGLALSGFTQYFAYKRVQVFGHAEFFYLRSLSTKQRESRYAYLFAYKIPCVIFSRGLKPDKEFLAATEKASVPVFQSPLVTMTFINAATLELENMFAPRGTEIGSMVDILGVGIINVAAMFGVKSVRKEKALDLVVTLKPWDEVEDVDRVGMEQEFVKVLGVDIPHITIPVRPGRDLARLVEVAAYQTKLKMSGQNAARELNDRLIAHMSLASRPPS